jgi:hypothetical protein
MTVKTIKQRTFKSTGRESHVFRVESPEGLIGVHADLIASSLRAEESIHYLIYAPTREAGYAPFGMYAEPASHALAVTDQRFLISKDCHKDNVAPTVQEIPFSQVVCVEIGNALLLGWLSIRFIENGQLSCTSLFYTARGSHHFERTVREFRNVYGKAQSVTPALGITWANVWEKTPKMQSDIIKSLILKEENPLYLLRSTESWGVQKRGRKKVCLATEGVLLVTDWGLIHAVDEQPVSPHVLSYGVNVRYIPLGALYALDHFEKEEHGVCRHMLRLQAGKPPALISYDIPFDESTDYNVAEFVHAMQEMKR